MIKEINKNQIINKSNESRYLFELERIDFEQKSVSEIRSLFSSFKRDISNLENNQKYKIYCIDDKTYLESSSSEISYFNTFRLRPAKDFITSFFRASNIFSNPVFKTDFCKLNGNYFRFISLNFKGDHQLDINCLQKYGNVQISFQKIKTFFSKKLINDARKMSHTALYQALSDIEGIESFRENEEMLRKIITKQEELFQCQFQIIVMASTENELQEKTKLLIESLELDGLGPKIETSNINNAFDDYTPGILPRLNNTVLCHTSLLVNCIPLHSDFLMHSGLALNSRSGDSLFFNSMIGDSYSICVTGRTGKGKTFFINKMIDYELSQGKKVFAFDPKGDYRKQAILKNAYIIDESINPMIFKDPYYLWTLILSKIPKNERTTIWQNKLLHIIKETNAYNENHFLNAIEKISKDEFKDLAFYFTDIEDLITDKKTSLNNFTYIEMSSFSSYAIPFLLSFSFEYVKRLNSPYKLIIDEAHRVFKHDPDFLEERVREMRSQESSLVTSTQTYQELIYTPDGNPNLFGRVVADSSFHKFFFEQNVEVGNGLDTFDIDMISTLRTEKGQYSEFYYKSDNHRKVLRYYPTLKELELFDSRKSQINNMLSFIKDNMSYFTVDECINMWVRNKYA